MEVVLRVRERSVRLQLPSSLDSVVSTVLSPSGSLPGRSTQNRTKQISMQDYKIASPIELQQLIASHKSKHSLQNHTQRSSD